MWTHVLLAVSSVSRGACCARLTQTILHLDRTISTLDVCSEEPKEIIVDSCLSVCAELGSLETPGTARELMAFTQARSSLLDSHLFETRLHDLLLDSLGRAAAEDDGSTVVDVANAIAASARFTLLPESEISAMLDSLASIVVSEDFLAARQRALSGVRTTQRVTSGGSRSGGECFRGPTAEHDEQLVASLYRVCAEQLGPRVLAPYGFSSSVLGVQCLVAAAAAAGGGQRAAASFGRIWHVSDGVAPIILRRAASTAAEDDISSETGPLVQGAGLAEVRPRAGRTLVVAFSSLGWHGLMRAEWSTSLRPLASSCAPVDVAHAIDPSRSWFSTNPMDGQLDGGAWWDAALLELCAPYERVCLIGESMGGTAALRFGRHARGPSGGGGVVVALVPQIDLRDFECCTRTDLTGTHKRELREAVTAACGDPADKAEAPGAHARRIMIHVGRDADDLHQLSYLPRVVASYRAIGEDAPDPLPRDGSTASRTVSCGQVCVVKHDVEGHSVGASLSLKGTLQSSVVDALLLDSSKVGTGGDGHVVPRAAPHARSAVAAASSRVPLVHMSVVADEGEDTGMNARVSDSVTPQVRPPAPHAHAL